MSNTPETDAFYGELHPDAHLLEHARSLERRLQEAQRERDEAVTMLRVIAEECVLATNLPGGDRAVSLTRVRQIIRERDAALRDAKRYRWLADKVIAPDYGDNDSDPHQKGYLIRHCKGPEVIYGESLDAAIDTAALAEKGKP